jgi:hypothetical protein
VSVGLSVSRVGSAAQIKATKQVGGKLKGELAQFRELAAFAQFGSDLDAKTKAQLDRGARIVELFKQPPSIRCPIELQVAVLFAMQKGFFDPTSTSRRSSPPPLGEGVLPRPQGRAPDRDSHQGRPRQGPRGEDSRPLRRVEGILHRLISEFRVTFRPPPAIFMASTRDIRRRIKSVKNTRQITKAMELVAASKMKKAQQAALAGRPYAQLMAACWPRSAARRGGPAPVPRPREVKTRGILLVTTDKGLCGPLNANLFKLVTEIKTPAKFAVVGRKGAQFIARTKRDLLADFSVSDRVAFAEVKVVVRVHGEAVPRGRRSTPSRSSGRASQHAGPGADPPPVLPLTGVHELIADLRRRRRPCPHHPGRRTA